MQIEGKVRAIKFHSGTGGCPDKKMANLSKKGAKAPVLNRAF
jgi:hypothetical protein